MASRLHPLLYALPMSIVTLIPLHAQTVLSHRDSLHLDSLDRLRRELVRAHEALPKYGVPSVDRLFRYEPVAPYNQDRGYQFLHAVAGSRLGSAQGDGAQGSLFNSLITLAAGKNYYAPKWCWGIDGVIDVFADNNPIDGQWLGYGFFVARELGVGQTLQFRTSLNYAVRSRNWYHEQHLFFYYAPRHNGLLQLSGGHTSRGTFHLTPEEIYRGYFGALPAVNSPTAEFAKDYLHVRNRISLSDEVDLSASLLFEDRKPQVDFSATHHRLFLASGQLLWAPSFLNESESGIPIPIGHRREVGFVYKQAFDPRSRQAMPGQVPYSRFQQLEVFMRGTFLLGEEHRIDMKVNAGAYLSRDYLSHSDEKYFAHISAIERTPFKDSWATLPPLFTGGKSWTTQEANFYSKHFLLSKTKGFGGFFRMDEMLHARQLFTSDGRVFSEVGYSMGWGDIARWGLFAGYDWQIGHPRMALCLSLPIFCLTATVSERYWK